MAHRPTNVIGFDLGLAGLLDQNDLSRRQHAAHPALGHKSVILPFKRLHHSMRFRVATLDGLTCPRLPIIILQNRVDVERAVDGKGRLKELVCINVPPESSVCMRSNHLLEAILSEQPIEKTWW